MSMGRLSEQYTTVKNESCVEFEEKRSIFIGHAIHVETEDEAAAFVKSMKKKYSDATHNVWAYLLKGGLVARYSDDGEPQGTSGMPTLNAIRMSGITDVLVVTTRYFGGILLGAGGLVRAYSTAASMALEAGGISVFEKYLEYTVVCSYSDYNKLLPIFSS